MKHFERSSNFARAAFTTFVVMIGLSYVPTTKHTAKPFVALKSLASIPKAFAAAAGHAPFTYMTTIRNNIGFVMGYGDGTSSGDFYAQTNCATQDPAPGLTSDCDDAPPRAGLVATASDMMNSLSTMLGNAGISGCSAIPSSGTADLEDEDGNEIQATFVSPSESVPAGWDNGGSAFTKAVELEVAISGSTTLMHAEFTCGQAALFVKLNMVVGAHAPGYERRINILTGTTAGVRVADVFITEVHDSAGYVRGAYALNVEINEAATTYKVRGTVTGQGGNTALVEKVNVHGNYSTNQASIYQKRYVMSTASYYDGSALAAMAGATSAAVGSTASYDLHADWCDVQSYSGGYPNCNGSIPAQTAGNIFESQGCIDLDAPTATLTSAALCTGLELSDPPAPSIDPDGAFSPAWLINTMTSHIDVSGIEDP